jgi:hypothetical protein
MRIFMPMETCFQQRSPIGLRILNNSSGRNIYRVPLNLRPRRCRLFTRARQRVDNQMTFRPHLVVGPCV